MLFVGREYRVAHTPFLMSTQDQYFGFYTYTFSPDGPPDALGNRWYINGSTAQSGPTEYVFTAQQSGVMRILLNVGRVSGTGINFQSSTYYAKKHQPDLRRSQTFPRLHRVAPVRWLARND